MMFFGYTNCPDFCPTTLTTLAALEKRLRAVGGAVRPQVIFVSVDAKRDTPQQLAKYVPYFDPEFLGVTAADQPTIETIARKLGVGVIITPAADGGYTVDHSGAIFVLDPEGKLAAILTGTLHGRRFAERILRVSWPPGHERPPVRLAAARPTATPAFASGSRRHAGTDPLVQESADPRVSDPVRRRHERSDRSRPLPLRKLQRVLHPRAAPRGAPDRRRRRRDRKSGRRHGERMRRHRARFAAASQGPALHAWRTAGAASVGAAFRRRFLRDAVSRAVQLSPHPHAAAGTSDRYGVRAGSLVQREQRDGAACPAPLCEKRARADPVRGRLWALRRRAGRSA